MVESHRVVTGRGLFCAADDGHRGFWKETEPACGFDPHAPLVNPRVVSKRSNLGLDRPENPGDLGVRPLQVFGRADPKRHGGDSEFAAPQEHLVELLRSQLVGPTWVEKSLLTRITAVAVENEPDMAGHRSRAEPSTQPALIELIEEVRHARSVIGSPSRPNTSSAVSGKERYWRQSPTDLSSRDWGNRPYSARRKAGLSERPRSM